MQAIDARYETQVIPDLLPVELEPKIQALESVGRTRMDYDEASREKLDELIRTVETLANENEALRSQHTVLAAERATLIDKTEQARSRVEAMIARLRQEDALPIGVAVMDQRLVAGIGNVWKSEGLFARGLDPFAPVARFTDDELRGLLTHVRALMQKNVDGTVHRRSLVPARGGRRVTRLEVGGALTGHAIYERKGLPCLACGTRIERDKQGTRTTYVCRTCQPSRAALGSSSPR
jgi:uncharacterized protein (TIGR02449 family)